MVVVACSGSHEATARRPHVLAAAAAAGADGVPPSRAGPDLGDWGWGLLLGTAETFLFLAFLGIELPKRPLSHNAVIEPSRLCVQTRNAIRPVCQATTVHTFTANSSSEERCNLESSN